MGQDLEGLRTTWLRYQQSRDRADFWAEQQMSELTAPDADPEAAWELVTRLVEEASDDVLGAVAVGPLEDVVKHFAPRLIAQIEQQARRVPRFRSALARIWITKGALPTDIEARVIAASNGAIRPLSGRKSSWGRRR